MPYANMHQITTCLNCGQTVHLPSGSLTHHTRCPACKDAVETSTSSTAAPNKRSTFEVLTWIIAILVLLPGCYFFYWLLASTLNSKPKTPTSVAGVHSVEDEPIASSPPGTMAALQDANATQTETPKEEGSPTPLSEEQKGFVFMHTIGFGKGIQWAKSYGRKPTTSEYVAIVAFATPDDPQNSSDLKLQEAFLAGFKAGCEHGLELQGPAF